MTIELSHLLKRLENTPPACLETLGATPAALPIRWDDNPRSVWRLSCRCGNGVGRLLGYHFRDPGCNDSTPLFISPLSFECVGCGATAEILDTDRHGYHVEIGKLEGLDLKSAKIRGEGELQRFTCPGCGGDRFDIVIAFVFWDAEELAEEIEFGWENFFNVFLCFCTCHACGALCEPTDFGKL